MYFTTVAINYLYDHFNSALFIYLFILYFSNPFPAFTHCDVRLKTQTKWQTLLKIVAFLTTSHSKITNVEKTEVWRESFIKYFCHTMCNQLILNILYLGMLLLSLFASFFCLCFITYILGVSSSHRKYFNSLYLPRWSLFLPLWCGMSTGFTSKSEIIIGSSLYATGSS